MGIEVKTFKNRSRFNKQISGTNNILIFFSLEAALRGLLGALTSTPYSPTQHLEREQALAKQFAEILHFTLRFDELKVGLFCWSSLLRKSGVFQRALGGDAWRPFQNVFKSLLVLSKNAGFNTCAGLLVYT